MKKPTLRFRQVFEHPTHFKVTKPLGNPMIIAKQGLSDAMQNRLRKYATAGEVTEPAPSEQDLSADSRALDVSPAIEAPKAPLMGPPTLAEIMSRPEFVGEEDRSETPVEVIKASDIAQAPVEALPVVAPEQALATPIVTVPQKIQAGELMGPPAPVEPVMKAAAPSEQEDPLVWMNKLIEEEKAKDKPNQETIKGYESARDQYVKQMKEEQVSAKSPAVVAPVTAPVVALPPAVPVVAAAPPQAPTPGTQAFTDTLSNLGFSPEAYEKLSPLGKMQANSLVKQQFALEQQAGADRVAVEAEMKQQKDAADEERKRLEGLTKRANESRDLQREILEEYKHVNDPGSYFSRLGTLGQIGTALSLAAGAFASGMTGMPNYAMQIYNNAVEADLRAQKIKSDSLYNRLIAAGHSADAAEDMVRASSKLIAGAEAGKLAAQVKLPQVRAKLLIEQGKLVNQGIMDMARIAQVEALPGEREEERKVRREQIAASQAGRAEAEARKKALDEQRAEEKQRKLEEERQQRLVSVGDSDLELKEPRRGNTIRMELTNRDNALTAAMRLERLIKEHGMEIFDPSSDYRGELIAQVGPVIENYPQGKGLGRAISVNAATFIKQAVQDPGSWQSAAKKLFLNRDPAIGISSMVKDIKQNYENSVKGYVRNPNSEAVQNALDQQEKRRRELLISEDRSTGGGFGFQAR